MATKTKKRKLNLARVKKLSTLLAIGLRDLRKQERAKNSVVEMGTWCRIDRDDGKCEACLAGSVMRFSLHHRPRCTSKFPSLWGRTLESRFLALDAMRNGGVQRAAGYMDVETTVGDFIDSCPYYDGEDGQWWSRMEQLLSDLKAAGE